MPHQCVKCSKIIEPGSKEILEGCGKCGGRFFFYIRDEKLVNSDSAQSILKLKQNEKDKIEGDVREILKLKDDPQPIILDLESVRVSAPGKFEIDLVSLLNRKPIIFKLEEGKYIIDLERLSGKN